MKGIQPIMGGMVMVLVVYRPSILMGRSRILGKSKCSQERQRCTECACDGNF
jgi:hypothetical protein